MPVSDLLANDIRKPGMTKPVAAKSRKAIMDYLSMIGFNGLVAILSFCTTSLLLTLLGRESYGEIVSLTSTTLFLAILGTDWTTQAAVRYGTEEFLSLGQINRFFWNRLWIALAGVLVVILISPIWGYFLENYIGLTSQGLAFILCYLPSQVYWMHLQRIMPAINHHRLLYPLLFVERAVVLSLISVLYMTGYLRISYILPGYVLGSIIAAVVATWLARREIGRPRRPDWATCHKILQFSWPMIPTVAIGLLSTNTLDYLIIRRYVGKAELGVYALAVQIAGMVQQIPQVAGQLVGPRFVAMRLKNDTSGLTHFIQKKVTPALWAWSICCLLGSILVSWQGPNWIPAKYMILTDLVWPLAAVTSIVPVWYIVWSPLLTAYEQVRVVMWSSVMTGVVNLSANLILIPQLGVIGSAWATVLAYFAAISFCTYYTKTNHEIKSLRPRGLIYALIVSSCGISVTLWPSYVFRFSSLTLAIMVCFIWLDWSHFSDQKKRFARTGHDLESP